MSEAASTPALALPAGIKKFRKVLLIGGGMFAGLLAVLIAIPHFLDLGLFKGTYFPLVEEALGRRVDVGEVQLRLVPTPSIRVSKLSVADNQSFPDNIFFAADQLQLKLKFLPLLRGRFEVTELVLDKPVFNLLKQTDGSFNYSDIAGKKNPPAPGGRPERNLKGGKAAKPHRWRFPPVCASAMARSICLPKDKPRSISKESSYRCKNSPATRLFRFAPPSTIPV